MYVCVSVCEHVCLCAFVLVCACVCVCVCVRIGREGGQHLFPPSSVRMLVRESGNGNHFFADCAEGLMCLQQRTVRLI